MPRVLRFEETPNPHALKCVLDGPAPAATAASSAPRSYRSPSSAAGDPLGAALLAVAGVAGVLIGDSWVTITRSPEVDWKTIKAGVQRVVEAS